VDDNNQHTLPHAAERLKKLIHTVQDQNQWFTPKNVKKALSAIALILSSENLVKWVEKYSLLTESREKQRIGIILAGNIPLVGFHDFLSVIIAGHHFFGKLSSKDYQLLPVVAEILFDIQPDLTDYIDFVEGQFKSIDAIIATGSDNSARYFDFYFSKYPNIIRRNRNGIAILNGSESSADLVGLGEDIFSYFGLGCRNDSKIYVPIDYDFNPFLNTLEPYRHLVNHKKYYNNYVYNRAKYLTQQIPVIDTGFLLLREEVEIASPPGVIFFEYYNNKENLKSEIALLRDKIQCIVSHDKQFNPVCFGNTQYPDLWDYADNIDTIEFLISLNPK
jgi:hypothetical protein